MNNYVLCLKFNYSNSQVILYKVLFNKKTYMYNQKIIDN
jgi:hypothetical protein